MLHTELDSSFKQPWCLVYSKSRQEQMTIKKMLCQGLNAWLPQIKAAVAGKHSTRRADRLALQPVFTRYLLTPFSHQEQSKATGRPTLGVSTLVRFGAWLATIDHKFVCGLAHIELAQRQLEYHQITPLQPGVVVQIIAGPLAGLKGLVSKNSSERVVVLLAFLGQLHELRFKPAQLDLAS